MHSLKNNIVPEIYNKMDAVRPYVRSARSAPSEKTHGDRSWHGAIHMSREDHTFQTRVRRSLLWTDYSGKHFKSRRVGWRDWGRTNLRHCTYSSAFLAASMVAWESEISSSSIGSSENDTVVVVIFLTD